MQPEKSLSYYIGKYDELSEYKGKTFDKEIRVAILSSFTLKWLEQTLSVKCADKKVRCVTYSSPYDQYNQDILNPKSELYRFSPDISFLLLDTRTILKDLFFSPYSTSSKDRKEYIKRQATRLVKLIRTFKMRSNSRLVLSNFSIPVYSPYGIYESKTEYGLKVMIQDLNSKLNSAFLEDPSVFLYDFNAFLTYFGETNVFDYRQFLFGDMKVSLNYIPYLAEEFMGYIKPYLGINRKCIVVDLDDTLWGGIVGEDGFEGIKLGPKSPGNAFVEFQQRLLSLYQRGIILAINSRNNPDDALKVIREHPYMVLREENFATMRINWNDKISNMKEISEELNIGLDSIVYFDDDPVNRELISKSMPEILTVNIPSDPSLYAPTVMNLNDFNVFTITEEDRKRGQMYSQQRKRIDLERSAVDLESFLSQLDIKVKIKTADEFTIPRIAQLTLKTNQFNLTTHRYQAEDIKKFSQNKNMIVGCAQVQDKFGDNGITGVFIVQKDSSSEWDIDTFLLSCRVMGRGVENAIMGYLLDQAKREGVTRVKGRYLPTEKNRPCQEFLANCGFIKEGGYWVYSSYLPAKIPKHLELLIEK